MQEAMLEITCCTTSDPQPFQSINSVKCFLLLCSLIVIPLLNDPYNVCAESVTGKWANAG